MRVLVCGGRDYLDWWAVAEELDALHYVRPITLLIHGGATGADDLAERWGAFRDVARRIYRADWERLGKNAGPMRNAEMIRDGQPDLVLAFPGGRGTADLVRRAKRSGITVSEVPAEPSSRATNSLND